MPKYLQSNTNLNFNTANLIKILINATMFVNYNDISRFSPA